MECCIDHLLITEVSVPIPEIICFSEGCPKGISCFSKDSIGFPKKLCGSPKGVSQIRIRVCQMMNVDQFDVFHCPNRSIMAAQISQTSWFSIGFFVENSEQSNNLRKSLLENTVHIA